MKKILKNKKLCRRAVKKFVLVIPRCYWKKAHGKRAPEVLIKYGDCNDRFIISYDKKDHFKKCYTEIAGVIADNKWWRELFKEVGII